MIPNKNDRHQLLKATANLSGEKVLMHRNDERVFTIQIQKNFLSATIVTT